MNDDALIREQIEYYRQRAPEYDETSAPAGDPFAAYGQEIQDALHRFAPRGNVLEIASGTGAGGKRASMDAQRAVARRSGGPNVASFQKGSRGNRSGEHPGRVGRRSSRPT